MAESYIFAGVAGYVGRPDATGAVGVFRRASSGGEWAHVFGDHPAQWLVLSHYVESPAFRISNRREDS